jgi:2-haloacid dehalogenase
MNIREPSTELSLRRRDILSTATLLTGLLAFGKLSQAATKTDSLHPDPATPFDLSKIKALAFDIQGTLLDYYTPVAAAVRHVADSKGLSLDVDGFITEWRNGYHDVIDDILAGRRAWIPTETVYADALEAIIDRHRLTDRVSRGERDQMTDAWAQMEPWPDSASALETMRKKFILTTLSNSGMHTVGRMLKKVDLRFDFILTGELAHSFKPDAGVYRLVPQNLGLPVDTIMMIACHKYDLKAARDFGFRTGYIPRPRELGPAGKADTAAEPYIDVMGSDLNDLAAKITG